MLCDDGFIDLSLVPSCEHANRLTHQHARLSSCGTEGGLTAF